MTPEIGFIATHNWRSTMGFREALLNRFAEQTGWFQKFTTPARHVFSKLLFPKGEFLKELYRGAPLVECSPLITLYYPPKESSLDSPRGPFGLSGSLYLVLSPKGEFSLRGVPLVEWLSLPYIMGEKFLPPYEPSKIFLLLDGRTDGRTGGRADMAYLPFRIFFGKKPEVFFFSFFLNVFRYSGERF